MPLSWDVTGSQASPEDLVQGLIIKKGYEECSFIVIGLACHGCSFKVSLNTFRATSSETLNPKP